MPNFAYSKHTRRLDEIGEVVAELDEVQFQDLIQQQFFFLFNSVLAGEKENLAKTELKFLKFSVAVWGPTTTTRLCNLRRTVHVHTVQNGWGVQKSSAASRAEIQFAQHPLTRSAQKFTVAMTRNPTIVRQIVYPSEHSLRMLRWIYEYDLRESTTVWQHGILFSFSFFYPSWPSCWPSLL